MKNTKSSVAVASTKNASRRKAMSAKDGNGKNSGRRKSPDSKMEEEIDNAESPRKSGS